MAWIGASVDFVVYRTVQFGSRAPYPRHVTLSR